MPGRFDEAIKQVGKEGRRKRGGGQVHARPHSTNSYGHPIEGSAGITRRDWLAGLAMQGIISSGEPWLVKQTADSPAGFGPVGELAYEVADAMIKEGKK